MPSDKAEKWAVPLKPYRTNQESYIETRRPARAEVTPTLRDCLRSRLPVLTFRSLLHAICALLKNLAQNLGIAGRVDGIAVDRLEQRILEPTGCSRIVGDLECLSKSSIGVFESGH